VIWCCARLHLSTRLNASSWTSSLLSYPKCFDQHNLLAVFVSITIQLSMASSYSMTSVGFSVSSLSGKPEWFWQGFRYWIVATLPTVIHSIQISAWPRCPAVFQSVLLCSLCIATISLVSIATIVLRWRSWCLRPLTALCCHCWLLLPVQGSSFSRLRLLFQVASSKVFIIYHQILTPSTVSSEQTVDKYLLKKKRGLTQPKPNESKGAGSTIRKDGGNCIGDRGSPERHLHEAITLFTNWGEAG
jgi:hypothetical protein